MHVVAWKVAASLDVLLGQLNTLAPRRSKSADGGIGDAAHASRDSDHNPWFVLAGQPLVTARDFTHDPAGGLNCDRLADALRSAKDPRVKYLIWDRRIMAGAGGPQPWVWRPYSGRDDHTGHVHLSVVADARCQGKAPWSLPGLTVDSPTSGVLHKGDSGPEVLRLQVILTTRYPSYASWSPLTEFFGEKTEAAVKEFQRRSGLVADGVVGADTRRALGL